MKAHEQDTLTHRTARKLRPRGRPFKSGEGRPFKPGAQWRGNAGGRPQRKHFTEMYEEILNDPEKRNAIKAQMFKTMSTKGMAGVLERREAAERLEGKVADSLDLNLSGKLTLEQVLEARKRAMSRGS